MFSYVSKTGFVKELSILVTLEVFFKCLLLCSYYLKFFSSSDAFVKVLLASKMFAVHFSFLKGCAPLVKF